MTVFFRCQSFFFYLLKLSSCVYVKKGCTLMRVTFLNIAVFEFSFEKETEKKWLEEKKYGLGDRSPCCKISINAILISLPLFTCLFLFCHLTLYQQL